MWKLTVSVSDEEGTVIFDTEVDMDESEDVNPLALGRAAVLEVAGDISSNIL